MREMDHRLRGLRTFLPLRMAMVSLQLKEATSVTSRDGDEGRKG